MRFAFTLIRDTFVSKLFPYAEFKKHTDRRTKVH